MRKDIEWLLQMIDSERESLRKRFESGKGTHNETTFNEGMGWALSKVLKMIYQLDKPEALSQEWIRNNQERKGVHFFVNVTKLQNLVVPKRELPVIPKLVADWIDENRGRYENRFFTIGYDLYDNAIHRAVGDWIIENEEKFVEAWFGAYEIEKEQKYYVNLDTAAYVAKWDGDDQIDIYTDAISGKDEYEFHLTEQEIKGFDERFWPFAEPVE